MKKTFTFYSIIALLLSQAGYAGPKNTRGDNFPYASQTIKEQLAAQLLNENDISADYFETIDYTPILRQMQQKGLRIFGPQEEQQLFWYYLMRLRILTWYHTFRPTQELENLISFLNQMDWSVRKFITRNPQKGPAALTAVIAYEEKYPYNPQKAIEEKRSQLKNSLRTVSTQKLSAILMENEYPAAMKNRASTKKPAGMITISNGEKEMQIPAEEFEKMTLKDFVQKVGLPPQEAEKISEKDFNRQKQDYLKVVAQAEGLAEELGDRLEYAMDQFNQAMQEASQLKKDQEFNQQVQQEIDALQECPAARQRFLQELKKYLEQIKFLPQTSAQTGLSRRQSTPTPARRSQTDAAEAKNATSPEVPSDKTAINTPDAFGKTPILRAITDGQTEQAKQLIAQGADVNFVNRFSESVLMVAIIEQNEEIVRVLIANRADVNYKNKFGDSPLQTARKFNYPAIADILKEAGAKE